MNKTMLGVQAFFFACSLAAILIIAHDSTVESQQDQLASDPVHVSSPLPSPAQGGHRATAGNPKLGRRPTPQNNKIVSTVDTVLSASILSEIASDMAAERRLALMRTEREHLEQKRRTRDRDHLLEALAGYEAFMVGSEEWTPVIDSIFDDYLNERYSISVDMELMDIRTVLDIRKQARMRLGRRLLTEIPAAQGSLIMRNLFL